MRSPATDTANSNRRSYECGQIVGPGNTGDVAASGSFVLQRAYPGVPAGRATLETLKCPREAGIEAKLPLCATWRRWRVWQATSAMALSRAARSRTTTSRSCAVIGGFLVNNEGYGLAATRRLPYGDYTIVLAQPIIGSGLPQTVYTTSYGANLLGLKAGKFVFIDLGGPDEEYVRVITVDPDSQTFDAIVTKDHAAGERIRPTIWPTPILNEGDDLAFDILAVASPEPGSDLTVVIQTQFWHGSQMVRGSGVC